MSKSHLIDKFLDFKFDNDTKALSQVKELEKLVMKLKDEKITLCNTFIYGAIVNKLPPSSMSLSTDIRRRKKKVSLFDLKRFIRIEDEIRTRAKNELLTKQKSSANMVASKSDKVLPGRRSSTRRIRIRQPECAEERVQEDWQVIQMRQARPLC